LVYFTNKDLATLRRSTDVEESGTRLKTHGGHVYTQTDGNADVVGGKINKQRGQAKNGSERRRRGCGHGAAD
jgi:hypothetical protein